MYPKLVVTGHRGPRIKDDPPLIFHLSASEMPRFHDPPFNSGILRRHRTW
jgi:hypothetical protein